MSQLFTFCGALLAFLWLALLVLGGLVDVAGAADTSLFDLPVPWFRWLTYAALFCVIGACCRFVFETPERKEPTK